MYNPSDFTRIKMDVENVINAFKIRSGIKLFLAKYCFATFLANNINTFYLNVTKSSHPF